MSVCKWKDCRNILTISYKHSVEMIEVKNKCSQVCQKPNIECDYNDDMTGSNKSDQMLSYFSGL